MERQKLSAVQGMFAAGPVQKSVVLKFNDDEPIVVQRFAEDSKIEEDLRISLRFCFDHIQLNQREAQEVPACVFIGSGTEGSDLTGRPGVDIVFTIDLSGSMMGGKLDLVKRTLDFAISKLTSTDRVSLVTFNNATHKLCPLLRMTDKNKMMVQGLVNQMRAYGGTEIIQGLDMSLKILAGRRTPNNSSVIVLLSDGKDNNSHSAMPRAKEILLRALHEIETGFSIHTFGYGGDHDATLLNAIAEEKNGGFYYVEHENVSMIFSNCLGELISVVADNIQVSLVQLKCDVPCNISKIYSETENYSFRLPPVLSGTSKEAVFLMNFPPFNAPIGTSIVIQPVKAIVTYKTMKTGRSYSEERFLNITVYPESAEIEELQLDSEVMVNFYRVKSADVMKEAATAGESGDLVYARELLARCAEELKNCVVYDSEVVINIIKDLDEIRQRLNSQVAYDVGGKADMLSKARNHMAKRAVAVGSYQNCMQTILNQECAKLPKFKP